MCAIYDPVESFCAFLRMTSWVESIIELVSPTADTITEDFYSGSIYLAYLFLSVSLATLLPSGYPAPSLTPDDLVASLIVLLSANEGRFVGFCEGASGEAASNIAGPGEGLSRNTPSLFNGGVSTLDGELA